MKVTIAGDFFGGGQASKVMKQPAVSFIDSKIIRLFKDSDLALLNLESPLTQTNKAINKSGPPIKASQVVADRIKEMGIDLVTLANNHIMDFGDQGFKDTLNHLEDSNLPYIGAGFNLQHAQEPYILTLGAEKLAVLNFCENEWSTTHGEGMGANPINEIDNYYQIKEAKRKADYVLVVAHGGHEHYSLPSPRVKKLYRFYADAGANAVVGHHTHCTSGYEVYNKVPIIYSLGNFLFASQAMQSGFWNEGLIANLEFKNKACQFALIHINQCNSEIAVKIASDEEIKLRHKKLQELNETILDDIKLEGAFSKWLESNYKMYRAYLEPHANRYLQYLQNRGLFPSFWHKRKRVYLMNLLRCEAHRDVVLRLLEDEISHSQ
jgi:poly-gamma-glutamate synthesis protein (capsule biosynthesis protein)